MEASSQRQRRLFEDVALMWMLGEEAGQPSENVVKESFRHDTHLRQMSLVVESRMVNEISFLLAADEDPTRVIAICLEELQHPAGVIVRLAVNAGGIQQMKAAMVKFSDILRRAATTNQSREATQMNLITKVIEFNRARILCRLRSKHAQRSRKGKRKPPVAQRLRDAVSLALRVKNDSIDGTQKHSIQKLTERFFNTFQKLENTISRQAKPSDIHNILFDILHTSLRLVEEVHIDDVLSGLQSTGNFDADTSKNISATIGKLGRYVSASRYLGTAAHKLEMFRNIRVQGVDQDLSTPLRMQGPFTSLEVVLRRIFASLSQQHIASLVRLYCGRTLKQANRQFQDLLQGSQSQRKVHAEVQLLFHYEKHQSELRPRVISSSKSACFLCNLFNASYDRFHIDRTHGVLYQKWALPTILSKMPNLMAKEIEAFLLRLETLIRARLHGQRQRRKHPSESVFFGHTIWTPSVQSSQTGVSSSSLSPGRSGEPVRNTGENGNRSIESTLYDMELSQKQVRETPSCSRIALERSPKSVNTEYNESIIESSERFARSIDPQESRSQNLKSNDLERWSPKNEIVLQKGQAQKLVVESNAPSIEIRAKHIVLFLSVESSAFTRSSSQSISKIDRLKMSNPTIVTVHCHTESFNLPTNKDRVFFLDGSLVCGADKQICNESADTMDVALVRKDEILQLNFTRQIYDSS